MELLERRRHNSLSFIDLTPTEDYLKNQLRTLYVLTQQVISRSSPHRATSSSSSAHANLHFLSSAAAVHGGPGDGVAVRVVTVAHLVFPLEAVSTDEHVVSVARARQVRSGVTPLAHGGQSGSGAVHAHVCGVTSESF